MLFAFWSTYSCLHLVAAAQILRNILFPSLWNDIHKNE